MYDKSKKFGTLSLSTSITSAVSGLLSFNSLTSTMERLVKNSSATEKQCQDAYSNLNPTSAGLCGLHKILPNRINSKTQLGSIFGKSLFYENSAKFTKFFFCLFLLEFNLFLLKVQAVMVILDSLF